MKQMERKKSEFSILMFLFFLLVLLFHCFFFSEIAHGESQLGGQAIEQEKAKNEVGFTVQPVLPDNQIDSSKGFYFIPVKAEEETKLTLKVKSTMKEARTVRISIEDAYTNQNGQIDYEGLNKKQDTSLKDPLSKITDVSSKEITVKNHEIKEVTLTIKTPKEQFDGVKAAAVCIKKVDSEKEQKGIGTTYGYRVGLVITEQEDIDYNSGTSLNLLKVKPTVHQGKRVIQTSLQNPEPKILDDLTVQTKLRKKGSKEVLRKRTTNDMRMAPNSQFDFATNWGVDPIKPGTYVLSVKATSKEKSWNWSKEFTIGEEQAKKINEEASYTLTYPKWIPIVVILLGILTITIIGCLYLRRKKWTEAK